MELPIIISEEEYLEALSCYQGICLTCGEFQDEVEPDAENYHCDSCDHNTVQGIENALIVGNIEIE